MLKSSVSNSPFLVIYFQYVRVLAITTLQFGPALGACSNTHTFFLLNDVSDRLKKIHDQKCVLTFFHWFPFLFDEEEKNKKNDITFTQHTTNAIFPIHFDWLIYLWFLYFKSSLRFLLHFNIGFSTETYCGSKKGLWWTKVIMMQFSAMLNDEITWNSNNLLLVVYYCVRNKCEIAKLDTNMMHVVSRIGITLSKVLYAVTCERALIEF